MRLVNMVKLQMQRRRRGLFGLRHSGIGIRLGSAMLIFGLLFILARRMDAPVAIVLALAGATVASSIGFLVDIVVATITMVQRDDSGRADDWQDPGRRSG